MLTNVSIAAQEKREGGGSRTIVRYSTDLELTSCFLSRVLVAPKFLLLWASLSG